MGIEEICWKTGQCIYKENTVTSVVMFYSDLQMLLRNLKTMMLWGMKLVALSLMSVLLLLVEFIFFFKEKKMWAGLSVWFLMSQKYNIIAKFLLLFVKDQIPVYVFLFWEPSCGFTFMAALQISHTKKGLTNQEI